jgi:hypothetical protein
MRPRVHQKRILSLLAKLRAEVSLLHEEHHIPFPNEDMHEIEIKIHDLTMDIERAEFIKHFKP